MTVPKAPPESAIAGALALYLLAFFTAAVVAAWLNQWTTVDAWSRRDTLPVAVFAAAVVGWFHADGGWRRRLGIVGCGVIALGGMLALSSLWLDFSWDGMSYHQHAVTALANGVNFLKDQDPTNDLWINNYARASWYYGASLFQWTKRPALGASYTFVLAAAAGCYGYRFCRWAGRGKGAGLTLAVLIVLSPVTLCQLYSYYNDAALGSVASVVFLSAILMLRSGSAIDRNTFLLSAVLVVNIKASGIIYLAAALCYLFAGWWIAEGSFIKAIRRWAVLLLIVGVMGYGVLGFSPYMQHVFHGRHIFYPIAGDHPVDIMTNASTPDFLAHGRYRNLFVSLFSQSANTSDEGGFAAPRLKIPGSVDVLELGAFTATDPRIGGFGPLFSLALITALISIVCGRIDWTIALPLGFVVLLSIIVNPYSWWARYTPTLWLLPLIPAISLRNDRWSAGGVASIATTIVLIVDLALILGISVRHNIALNDAMWATSHRVGDQEIRIHPYASYLKPDMELSYMGMRYRYVSDDYYLENKRCFTRFYTKWILLEYELPRNDCAPSIGN